MLKALEDSEAADTLPKVGVEEDLETLLAQLNGPDADKALYRLANLKDPRAADPILSMLQRRHIWPLPGNQTDANRALSNNDYGLLMDASDAILKSGDLRGLPPFLSSHGVTWLFMHAGEGDEPHLEYLGPPAFEPLAAALHDTSLPDDIRCTALLGLSEVDWARAVPVIRDMLPEMDIELRAAATDALGEMPEPSGAVLLALMALTDKDMEIRRIAVQAIEWYGGPEGLEAVRRVAEGDPRRRVRADAWAILGRTTGRAPPRGTPSQWCEWANMSD